MMKLGAKLNSWDGPITRIAKPLRMSPSINVDQGDITLRTIPVIGPLIKYPSPYAEKAYPIPASSIWNCLAR